MFLGMVEIFVNPLSEFKWGIINWTFRLNIFLTVNLKGLYIFFVFGVLFFSLVDFFNFSFPLLFLLLIPALIIFKNELAGFIQIFRVRKIGPVEFERQRKAA